MHSALRPQKGEPWSNIIDFFLQKIKQIWKSKRKLGSTRPMAACPKCTWSPNKADVWRLKCFWRPSDFCIYSFKCFAENCLIWKNIFTCGCTSSFPHLDLSRSFPLCQTPSKLSSTIIIQFLRLSIIINITQILKIPWSILEINISEKL